MSLLVFVISPERKLFEGQAVSVQVPGANGSFLVLPGHAPLLSELQGGDILIRTENNEEKIFVIEGGFVEVQDNRVTALVEAAFLPEELNKQKLEEELNALWQKSVSGEENLKIREKKSQILRAKLRRAS